MTNATPPSFTSFDGVRRIAQGSLATNALEIKRAAASGATGPLFIFDDQTGRIVEVDIRGTDADTLARLPKPPGSGNSVEDAPDEADPTSAQPRGRGRPKLGVIAREVTLLPRHWDWLSAQPGGASVALRKLVEEARRTTASGEDRRMAQERAYQFMSAMAGDLAGFEESSRALFAGDARKFTELTAAWPADVREYVLRLGAIHLDKANPGQNLP
jgi:hypothetical protein